MRKPVGKRSDAIKALKGDLEFVGAGAWRRVFVNDGIVYKVERSGGNEENESEYKNYKRLSKKPLPPNLKIPRVTQWTIKGTKVNAMPFVKGEPSGTNSGLPPELYDWLKDNGMRDMWGDNIRQDENGVYHIVDIQF